VKIGAGIVWTQISTVSSANHTVALDQNGNTWGWGGNNEYQLGDGTTTNRPSPVTLYFGTSYSVHAGSSHSFNTWYGISGCGLNQAGYVGTGNTQAVTTPSYISMF
jgi:alpha-tubulin suppressor-like RCC1 family protein